MTVNYTTLLQLPQPVDGTEAGTWGDVLNNAQAAYLDIAIAGGLAVSITSADVTLTATQGTSSATNIGSTTSQYAILNVSGAMTGARNLIVPSTSKWYIINNTCTGGFTLTVKGSATTGITLINGEKALVAWNGSDFVKISSAGATGAFTTVTATNPNIANPNNVGGYSSGTLNYNDTGLFSSYQTSINGYAYSAVQNTSSGGYASTDFAIYNNNTGSTYVNAGINSSGYGAFSGLGGTGGVSSTTLTITTATTGNLLYGAVISGTGVTGSPTITTQLTATGTAVATPTGTGTSGTSVLTVSANTGIAIGQLISGTGIPTGTFVGSFGTSNALQINLVNAALASVNLTTTASGTYNFYLQGGAGTYTLSSAQTVSNGTTITAQVAGSFNQPNNGYIYSYNSDMVVGTYSANSLRLNVNNSATDSMVVAGATGLVAFPGTGAITLPAGTTAQQPTPTVGMLRYNSTTNAFEGYSGSSPAWASVGGGATGGGSDQIFWQNGQTVNTNYTITTGTNAGTFGPVSVASGITVTVPSGSVWSIV